MEFQPVEGRLSADDLVPGLGLGQQDPLDSLFGQILLRPKACELIAAIRQLARYEIAEAAAGWAHFRIEGLDFLQELPSPGADKCSLWIPAAVQITAQELGMAQAISDNQDADAFDFPAGTFVIDLDSTLQSFDRFVKCEPTMPVCLPALGAEASPRIPDVGLLFSPQTELLESFEVLRDLRKIIAQALTRIDRRKSSLNASL